MTSSPLPRTGGLAPANGAESVRPAQPWQYPALGAAAALFLYFHLFHFPFVPIWHWGDQYLYLEHAERMLHGAVLYRDLFQFNLPGTEFLYFALFRIFGIGLRIAPLALLVAGTAATLLVYALARKVLTGAATLAPPLALLVICMRTSLDGTHHWYSTVLVLWAVNIVTGVRTPHQEPGPSTRGVAGLNLGAKTKRRRGWDTQFLAAGALLGLASVFTSSRGLFVVLGIAAFLLWKLRPGRAGWQAVAALLLPYAAVVGSVFLLLAGWAGTRTVFESVILFPLRYYSAGDANSFSVYFEDLQSLFPLHLRSVAVIALWIAVNAATPLLLAAFFAGPFRRRSTELRKSAQGQRLVLFAIVGLSALLAVAGAPATPRLSCAAAFAYLLAAYMLRQSARHSLIRGTVVALILLGVSEIAAEEFRLSRVLEGPRGAVVFQQADAFAQFAWVNAHTHPGDRLFGNADMNFLFGLANPTPLPYATADAYTRPEQVRQVIAALQKWPTRFIVWSDEADKGGSPQDSLGPLRSYLHQNYRLAQRFDDGTRILMRGDNAESSAPPDAAGRR